MMLLLDSGVGHIRTLRRVKNAKWIDVADNNGFIETMLCVTFYEPSIREIRLSKKYLLDKYRNIILISSDTIVNFKSESL